MRVAGRKFSLLILVVGGLLFFRYIVMPVVQDRSDVAFYRSKLDSLSNVSSYEFQVYGDFGFSTYLSTLHFSNGSSLSMDGSGKSPITVKEHTFMWVNDQIIQCWRVDDVTYEKWSIGGVGAEIVFAELNIEFASSSEIFDIINNNSDIVNLLESLFKKDGARSFIDREHGSILCGLERNGNSDVFGHPY